MNNQIKYIVILLTFPIFVNSQKKFTAGINANTQISIMTIKNSKSVGGTKEKAGLGQGYSFGVQVQFELNEKMMVRSGLNYQNRKYRHKIEGLIFETDLLNGTKSSLQNDITTTSFGIPIDFGYKFKSKKERINYLIGFGGILNIELDTKTKAKFLHEKINDQELTHAKNIVDESFYSLGIFVGMEIQMSKKVILGIEPYVRFTPNKFTLYYYNSDAKTLIENGITLRFRIK
ncbi:MAG: outer membrane beta-barrel protein [Saprospiraceae bacterium]